MSCSSYPAITTSESDDMKTFLSYLGPDNQANNIANIVGSQMLIWDSNFASLSSCQGKTYKHSTYAACQEILAAIQNLNLSLYYSCSPSYILNPSVTFTDLCSPFAVLYDAVNAFDQQIAGDFQSINNNIDPTSMHFPLDNNMPSCPLSCSVVTSWQVLNDLMQGIVNYFTVDNNKCVQIGNAFATLFAPGTCTYKVIAPSIISRSTITTSTSTTLAWYDYIWIVIVLLTSLILSVVIVWTCVYHTYDYYRHIDWLDNFVGTNVDRNIFIWKTWWFLIACGIFAGVLALILVFKILPSIKQTSSPITSSSSSKYSLYKKYTAADLKQMIPDGLNGDFILSASYVDAFPGGTDPTHGSQIYIAKDDPNDSLIEYETSDQTLRIKVSTSQTTFHSRKAVRMAYKDWLQTGVVVLECTHIPTGPGVWPSFWLNGQMTDSKNKWAASGEIDIIEGVTSRSLESTSNHSTLHTQVYQNPEDTGDDAYGKDCKQMINGSSISCSNLDENNPATCGWNGIQKCPYDGCSYPFTDTNSFGVNFNNNGGGVYACRVTEDNTITIWFWSKEDTSRPSDLFTDNPNVDSWTTSDSTNTVQFKSCPKHFQNLAILFNTAICGDWGGRADKDAFNSDCDCNIVCNDPANNKEYTEAYWAIKNFAIYTIQE